MFFSDQLKFELLSETVGHVSVYGVSFPILCTVATHSRLRVQRDPTKIQSSATQMALLVHYGLYRVKFTQYLRLCTVQCASLNAGQTLVAKTPKHQLALMQGP